MISLKEIFSKYIFPSDPTIGKLGSIDLNIFFIHCSGVPLLGAKRESSGYQIFVAIYGFIAVTFITFIYTGFEIYDLVSSWGNLNEVTSNTCLSFTHITGAIKIVNIFYRRKDIVRIIHQIKMLTKRYVVSEEQKIAFYSGELENKIPLTIYSTLVGFTGVFGMILILFNPTQIAGEVFPYRVRMPDFIPYIVQLIYMSISVLVAAIQIVGIDYLNVTLINQTRFQMKTLNIAFDRLAVSATTELDVSSKLNSVVEYHNIILELRKDIEDIFKYPLLLQFLTSLMIFALTGFQATVQMELKSGIMIYFYCLCIFCELFVYCWFGNEISEQHKSLASQGYNSAWYNFDAKNKRSLIIFMTNAQRPFNFTAGGFLNLSLQTFSGILSKSYTYMAVLRQVYSK